MGRKTGLLQTRMTLQGFWAFLPLACVQRLRKKGRAGI
jgi:hypothetical protein